MTRLILGKAGAGKTGKIMREIGGAVREKRGGSILLVPEQYSHEAERELSALSPDSLSLYAEVLSFTGLARRVFAETGGNAGTMLDQAGRMLCMARALDAVGSRLQVYKSARRRAEAQKQLLGAIDEMKNASASPEALVETAERVSGDLAEKLRDLSLVWEAYDAVVAAGRADPADRLERLAKAIPGCSLASGRVYIDGFTDFTQRELAVIEALIKSGAEVTLCLTCDGLRSENEAFELPRKTARRICACSEKHGVECRIETMEGGKEGGPSLKFLTENLFGYTPERLTDTGAVTLYRAEDITSECEFAAAKCLALVREEGCRFRDIAIAARGFESYRAALESVFSYYGVPLFTAKRSDIQSRPLPLLISSAFESIYGGFSPDDVFACLRTGLFGLSEEECDELENYVFRWSLRGSAWTREEGWRLHPGGGGKPCDEKALQTLGRVNALRLRVAEPISKLARRGALAKTAMEQAVALSEFFEDIGLAERLAARAASLAESGEEALAAEYMQLWDIAVNALEQCASILGDAEMGQEEFSRLYTLMLAQYDVGTIPVSIDRVSAGDMDRMRRRHIRHLIVLGASDERLPAPPEGGGLLTPSEREALLEAGLDIGGTSSEELSREFGLIYNCLTLPSDTLTITYCARGGEGNEARPSFVMERARILLNKEISPIDRTEVKAAAENPALELAASALRRGPGGAESRAEGPALAALRYFTENGGGEKLEALKKAAALTRGELSPRSVRALYGEKPRLSASRAEKLASCRFAYFLQYGLKAEPREPEGFDPPEMGSFVHFILERVCRALAAEGGFQNVPPARVDALTEEYMEEYISGELNGFRERSPRFVYLFRRLSQTVRRIVRDTVEEFSVSDFTPLDFELAIEREIGGEARISGSVDRVDGWAHKGKLYLRVVDYKTGRRAFSLSDVLSGMNLQMLIYLFSLAREGKERYGAEVVPAGVLYVPARDARISAPADLPEDEIAAEKAKAARRSGLLLGEGEVLAAMERGDSPRYLPVRFNREGAAAGDALATAEQLGALSRYVDKTLASMARELKRGGIAADPYFRSQQENACAYCDFVDACHFSEEKDERRWLSRKPAAEVWKTIEEGDGQDG